MSDASQYLVSSLTPERVGGGKAKVYQLTADSVHPTRVIGRDEYGNVIEETVSICPSRQFVTRSGCINNVPMRTAPNVNDHESLQIEQYTLIRVITQGFLPVDECPYTTEYRSFMNGPLVTPTNGEQACGGKPGGCEHLHAVMKKRRDRSLANWRADEDKAAKMKADDVANLAAAVGKAIADNQASGLQTARQRARNPQPAEE